MRKMARADFGDFTIIAGDSETAASFGKALQAKVDTEMERATQVGTAIHYGTQNCPACEPLKEQLAAAGLPTCMGWAKITDTHQAAEGEAVGICVDCKTAITATGKRGRPSKRCQSCNEK
jgi:hypothetical protein